MTNTKTPQFERVYMITETSRYTSAVSIGAKRGISFNKAFITAHNITAVAADVFFCKPIRQVLIVFTNADGRTAKKDKFSVTITPRGSGSIIRSGVSLKALGVKVPKFAVAVDYKFDPDNKDRLTLQLTEDMVE